MKKHTIAIDVDLTVVNTLYPWLDWFKSKTGRDVKNEDCSYDLVPEMLSIIKETKVESFDPFEFWHKTDLYDSLVPIKGSAETIQKLCEKYNVVFVSSCVPEHTSSKIRFLKKYFPAECKFIATHSKELVDYDYLIDDRLEHIRLGNEFRPDSYHFLFTGLRKDGTYEQRNILYFEEVESWEQILNFFFPT